MALSVNTVFSCDADHTGHHSAQLSDALAVLPDQRGPAKHCVFLAPGKALKN